MSTTQTTEADAQTQTESQSQSRLPSVFVLGSTVRSVRHTYTDESKGNGDRNPRMAVLPDGRHAGRVYTAGVLVNVEDVSNESDEPYLKAEIIAGDERILVMAGQYQREARATLQQLNENNNLSIEPVTVGVTGKIRTYKNDGTVYANIRPDSLTEISQESYNNFCEQAADDTAEASADILDRAESGDDSTEMMVWNTNHDTDEVKRILENIDNNVLANLN